MKINRDVPALVLTDEEGFTFVVRHANRGEPYRDVVTLELRNDLVTLTDVSLDLGEARALQAWLGKFLG